MEEITNYRVGSAVAAEGEDMTGHKDTLLQMRKELRDRIAANRRSLRKMPEGVLVRNRNKKGENYYYQLICQDGRRSRKGITKDMKMKCKLARKAFLKRALDFDMKRLRALDSALKCMPEDNREYDIDELPAACHQIERRFLFVNDPEKWLQIRQSEDKSEYVKNNIHPTNAGIMTKSKDEARIGNLFEAKGILYRYEQALTVSHLDENDGKYIDEIFHPDFLIYPEYYPPIIWEHCGVMNDPKYFDRLMRRIRIYYENGYTLWNNLILSFDDLDGSFNEERIRAQIRMYLHR